LRVDFIWDSGVSNAGVHTAMVNVAKQTKSLALCSIDNIPYKGRLEDLLNSDQVRQNKSDHSYRLAPFNNTSFGDYKVATSPLIEYMASLTTNKANNAEFAAVFGLGYGTITNTNLTEEYNKVEREYLLGSKVNTIKFDKFRGTTFINSNVTGVTTESLFNEEQIIRMANRISWDLGFLMEQFLGRNDVESTASDVRSLITYYFKTNIMNQTFAPSEFKVTVDSTNNIYGDGILNVNVDIYVSRALKVINVFSKSLPLSSLTS
jgi:hypothetical protein